MRLVPKVLILVGVLLLIWSVLFVTTYQYPFHWDDYHQIRRYTAAEIGAAFHGEGDPDKIETPGLRPVSILLWNLQEFLCGENIVEHRVFMIILMGILLSAVGLLLARLGLHFFQITIVLTLFVFSRVFAALVLWLCLSPLILAYIFITLSTSFFVFWIKSQRQIFFILMLLGVIVAAFTREETYTLPIALPLLWWCISGSDRTHWRQVTAAAFVVLLITCFHYWLWHFLVPKALSPRFTIDAGKWFLTAVAASWLPGGYTWVGYGDKLIGLVWIGFLIELGLLFVTFAHPRARWQLLGICCLGTLLCLPALGEERSYGIALPTLTFMSAISIAVAEVYAQIHSGHYLRRWQGQALAVSIILGLAFGIGGGIRRSFYVAESLRPNCAPRLQRDGEFLFDFFEHPATILEQRRIGGITRLSSFGINSPDDLQLLENDLEKNRQRYQHNRETGEGIFLPKYDYLLF